MPASPLAASDHHRRWSHQRRGRVLRPLALHRDRRPIQPIHRRHHLDARPAQCSSQPIRSASWKRPVVARAACRYCRAEQKGPQGFEVHRTGCSTSSCVFAVSESAIRCATSELWPTAGGPSRTARGGGFVSKPPVFVGSVVRIESAATCLVGATNEHGVISAKLLDGMVSSL
jgi:hypothetical protein